MPTKPQKGNVLETYNGIAILSVHTSVRVLVVAAIIRKTHYKAAMPATEALKCCHDQNQEHDRHDRFTTLPQPISTEIWDEKALRPTCRLFQQTLDNSMTCVKLRDEAANQVPQQCEDAAAALEHAESRQVQLAVQW